MRYVIAWVLVIGGWGCSVPMESSAGPCTLGVVSESSSGVTYRTLPDHDCDTLGPGPNGATCFDPYLNQPGNTGLFVCCAAKDTPAEDAYTVCVSKQAIGLAP
jgi:hypothetical protein